MVDRLGFLKAFVVRSCIIFEARLRQQSTSSIRWTMSHYLHEEMGCAKEKSLFLGKSLHPRAGLSGLRLKAVDGGCFFHRQPDVVQTVHQAMFLERVNFKVEAFPI